ncbi:hypothetical protein VFPFJ_10931 [Purpureocillium lilacinum]|uniref:Uncharacterized protein n=1 Tax=Purpureocillium lilacinum TaxID=33203 RepID=A0A179G995_PURLI|nr:hypothetical protein VFPFJ_10931 [Purpureocillium lilacinum]OAQ74385.1 hypothetical protein VFPFJ_10931 [Purpureocillium lilacinum]
MSIAVFVTARHGGRETGPVTSSLDLPTISTDRRWWSRPLPQSQFAGQLQTEFETIKGLWRRARFRDTRRQVYIRYKGLGSGLECDLRPRHTLATAEDLRVGD